MLASRYSRTRQVRLQYSSIQMLLGPRKQLGKLREPIAEVDEGRRRAMSDKDPQEKENEELNRAFTH